MLYTYLYLSIVTHYAGKVLPFLYTRTTPERLHIKTNRIWGIHGIAKYTERNVYVLQHVRLTIPEITLVFVHNKNRL